MISSFSLYPFKVPCSFLFKEREGMILHAILDTGEERFGELSPLPGFSKETLSEALYELTTILKDPLSLDILPHLATLPSVFFALYSLTLPNVAIKAPLSGLVNLDKYEEEILRLHTLGIKEAKIKVGVAPIELTLERLAKCLDLSQGKRSFHLDINQKWSLDDWEKFYNFFPKDSFHYIEEPVKADHLTLHFIQNGKHRIALDESLRANPNLIQLDPYCLVIKPMLDSSFTKHSRSQNIALSSSFETSIGTRALCQIHAKSSSTFHLGADVLKYLSSPLFPYTIQEGEIQFDPFDFEINQISSSSFSYLR
jgi:O-succinylbenzoate synthase